MMQKECRWMKQKVCTNNGNKPAKHQKRTWKSKKKDPIQQLLEPLANAVQTLLEPIGKLLAEPPEQCKWVPKEWCEQVPKEWCEPTTKQKCEEVGIYNCCTIDYYKTRL